MIAKAKAPINSMNVEAKNPIKDPKAALSAVEVSCFEKISSAKNAPKKGKVMTLKGMGVKSPIRRPRPAPYMPYLLPPNLLTPKKGIR